MARSTEKLVVAPRCRGCGRPRYLTEGEVAFSSYGHCCSASRLRRATAKLGLKPITPADFDGRHLTRKGR